MRSGKVESRVKGMWWIAYNIVARKIVVGSRFVGLLKYRLNGLVV